MPGLGYEPAIWQKLAGWFGSPVKADEPGAALFNFRLTAGVTTEWQTYTVGPLEPVEAENLVKVLLTVDNLDANEALYLDNIILKEYIDNFYVVQNSWNTPESCTPTMLGCQDYTDRQGEVQPLKSFSQT